MRTACAPSGIARRAADASASTNATMEPSSATTGGSRLSRSQVEATASVSGTALSSISTATDE
ncbi:hypothetical protein [Streptomyces sp. NPDC001833]|uniref:hypothetical protein n=1 Tax=Streptomyces sp. NPDC001833 TaxID=3154658 RepID=UPI0033243A44